MNKHGQAARFAYDPAVVVAYFASLPKPSGFKDDTHGRILRRWRTAKGVTRPAFQRMAACYSVTTDAFEQWCITSKLTPVLRDKNTNRR